MKSKPTTKKLYQLVDIKDYRYDKGCADINYGDIATDCDTKTISLLEAINHISLSILSLADEDELNNVKISTLSCIIADLAELGIATNKISHTATYLSGVQDGTHGA